MNEFKSSVKERRPIWQPAAAADGPQITSGSKQLSNYSKLRLKDCAISLKATDVIINWPRLVPCSVSIHCSQS